ncbi:hypothetical protein WDU94_002439 [Cyamophila willieti]
MSTESGNHNSKTSTAASHFVWVDCEMTGLDPRKDCILEIACLVTDAELRVIDSLEIVIQKSEDILKEMNEWCVTHHTASGLVDKVRQSSTDIAQADDQLLKFVSKYVPPGTAPLAAKKRLKHRGLNDIEDTIEEFRFYRQHFLKTSSNTSDEYPSAVPYC